MRVARLAQDVHALITQTAAEEIQPIESCSLDVNELRSIMLRPCGRPHTSP